MSDCKFCNGTQAMLKSFTDWLAAPFSEDMDALHWFYFFGLIIVILAAWGIILRAMQEATA